MSSNVTVQAVLEVTTSSQSAQQVKSLANATKGVGDAAQQSAAQLKKMQDAANQSNAAVTSGDSSGSNAASTGGRSRQKQSLTVEQEAQAAFARRKRRAEVDARLAELDPQPPRQPRQPKPPKGPMSVEEEAMDALARRKRQSEVEARLAELDPQHEKTKGEKADDLVKARQEKQDVSLMATLKDPFGSGAAGRRSLAGPLLAVGLTAAAFQKLGEGALAMNDDLLTGKGKLLKVWNSIPVLGHITQGMIYIRDWVNGDLERENQQKRDDLQRDLQMVAHKGEAAVRSTSNQQAAGYMHAVGMASAADSRLEALGSNDPLGVLANTQADGAQARLAAQAAEDDAKAARIGLAELERQRKDAESRSAASLADSDARQQAIKDKYGEKTNSTFEARTDFKNLLQARGYASDDIAAAQAAQQASQKGALDLAMKELEARKALIGVDQARLATLQ